MRGSLDILLKSQPAPADTTLDGYRHGSTYDDQETLLPVNVSEEIPGAASPELSRRQGPVAACLRGTTTWIRGPQPPRIYSIRAVFPAVQHTPMKLLHRHAPKPMQRLGLALVFWATWISGFLLLQRQSYLSISIADYGTPIKLSCAARAWRDDNGCSLGGLDCGPFDNVSMAFRCPSNCGQQLMYNQHQIGQVETEYKTLVVGGRTNASDPLDTAVYHADSFICSAAVHAGFLDSNKGGCGVLEYAGARESFPGSVANGIESIGFDSYFPRSFRFKPGTQTECDDSRWSTLAFSFIFTIVLSLCTTSSAAFSWSTFFIMFATVAFATDPPDVVGHRSLISITAGQLLPACFCMAVMYHCALRRTLDGLDAQVEKTLLWLGPAWITALYNYTLDNLMPSRLTPHDIQNQPGKIPVVIFMTLLVLAIALGQAWCFRIEGRMLAYLKLYGLLTGVIVLLLIVPDMHLRIHHYIIGLLLLPGTSLQTRPSLIYQGLLFGLFINGVAKWGFAPILETSAEMSLNDGVDLPSVIVSDMERSADNITFLLGPLQLHDSQYSFLDGFSALVNGVEQLRVWGNHETSGDWSNGSFLWTWTRQKHGLPEYFRFAFMMGSKAGEYTKTGIWAANGIWTTP